MKKRKLELEKKDVEVDSDDEGDWYKEIREILESEVSATSTTDFLAGDTEMSERIKNLNWNELNMPSLDIWPQSLKTATSMILASRYAMNIWWGPELRYIYNDSLIKILGSRHPHFLGQPAREAWVDIWDSVYPLMLHVYQTGKATLVSDHLLPLYNAEEKLMEERYFTHSYSPIRREDGKIGGLLNTTTETTSRVVQERQLRTLRDMSVRTIEPTVSEAYKTIIEGMAMNKIDIPMGALYIVENNTLQIVGITGISQITPFLPENISLINPTTDPWSSLLISVFTSAKSESIDITNYDFPSCGHWNQKPTRSVVLPVLSPGNSTPTALLVLCTNQMRVVDETYLSFLNLLGNQVGTTLANARARQEERDKAEALAQLDRAKTIFFSNISHEFRTPLTLMIGPLEDVLERSTNLNTHDREQLVLVRRNTLRLLKLVNTLLDFSRIEAGRAQARYEATDLSSFTKDLASVFRAACEKEGLSFQVECNSLPELVYIDRDMWEKIVLNLLSNAYKFTLKGFIRVRLEDRGPEVRLTITDSGTGIPADELPKLFERFHRVKGSQGRTHEGTGIGLALVNELVKLHGGQIQVESSLGHGTMLSVHIPYGFRHLPHESVKTEISESPTASKYCLDTSWWIPNEGISENITPSPTETSEKKHRIVLADDNADMREYVHKLLAPHYYVDMATNGQEALDLILENPPDLVLSDIMMPVMDGFGLLKSLREDESTKTIPVIFLSARAGEEFRVEGYTYGADDYLVKPFTARELLARIKSHLQMSEMRLVAMQNAKRANEAKDHFLALLSHELRTPLTPALLLAESLAADENLDANIREDIRMIARNVKLEVQLIDDLLDVTKITKKKLVLNRHVVSIKDIVTHSIQIVQHDAEEKEIKLESTWRAKEEYVSADAARIQQVLWNVLKNAVKFTPQKGSISLHSYNFEENFKKFLRIDIRDTGIGISEKLLPRIFETFEQGGEDVTSKFGGLGLGLAISRAITDMHEGQLYATSEGVGKGSTFTVILPTVEAPDYMPMVAETTRGHPRKFLEILVVEDNKPTLFVLQRLLNRMGHKAFPAASISEAITLAEQRSFDMLISDIGLPDGSGVDLVKRIKKIHPFMGAIALSGYGMEEDITRSREAGFQMHLTKPVEAATLESAIESLIAMSPPRVPIDKVAN